MSASDEMARRAEELAHKAVDGDGPMDETMRLRLATASQTYALLALRLTLVDREAIVKMEVLS